MRTDLLIGGGLLFGLLLSLAAPPISAQQSDPSGSPEAARPRIGLVLAGGGAKGGAHVGVLKVLEEMHVPVDCIAGTSMGALVGGGYASGIPAAQMDAFIHGINWRSVVGGVGQRDLVPIEQKRKGVTYSNQLQLGLQHSQVVMAPGLINTSGIDNLLRGFVGKARAQDKFDKLPIPYRAVATDMVSGNMVVLDHGDLATAMRASMAVPGVFSPVIMDDYVLSDGGLVRNIPVDVARKTCADVVIVVNLVEPPVTAADLKGAGQIVKRMGDLLTQTNARQQLDTLTPRDVRIDVQMGDIGAADFERTPETIALGEAAARRAAPELARYAVPPEQYLAWRRTVTFDQGIQTRIADVRFTGLQRLSALYVRDRTELRPGDTVTTEQIGEDAKRISVLEDVESVAYELTGDPAAPTLEWRVQEKSWGPNYLKVDFGLYSSAAGDSLAALYAEHTETGINRLGAQWRNEAQLGSNPSLGTSFYQPVEMSQRIFIEPQLDWQRTREDVYYEERRVARYFFSDLVGRIDLGFNVGRDGQLRVGYEASRQALSVDTGATTLPQGHHTDAGLVVTGIYDSRDSPFTPTRGIASVVEYTRSDSAFGGQRDWERAEMGVGVAIPAWNDVLWVTAAGGSQLGSTLPADRLFELGGPASFPGYEVGELRVGSYWTVNGSYLWRIKDLFSLRGQALYAGLRLQTGRVSESLDGRSYGQIASASAYLAGRTPIGPLSLGFAATNTSARSVWLSIGRPLLNGSVLDRGIFR